MASSSPGSQRDAWVGGRGFAFSDPERQHEVVGYVRSGPPETMPAERMAAPRGSRLDWARVLPERDGGNFEGSSSRRGR